MCARRITRWVARTVWWINPDSIIQFPAKTKTTGRIHANYNAKRVILFVALCAPLFPSKFMSHGKHRKSIFQRICEPLNASIYTERRVLILFARFPERHWKLTKVFQRLYVQHIRCEARLITQMKLKQNIWNIERISSISILIVYQGVLLRINM